MASASLSNNIFEASLKYLRYLNPQDQEIVFMLMRSNFKHVKDNTYTEQLSGLIATLHRNKMQLGESWGKIYRAKNALPNKLVSRFTLTDLQKKMLFQLVDYAQKDTSLKNQFFGGKLTGSYPANFQKLLNILHIYAGYAPFDQIVLLLINSKGNNDQAEVLKLTNELMKVLPIPVHKRAVLEGIQYVDLILKTESLKYIPQDASIQLTSDQHELLQNFVHSQLPNGWTSNPK
ncbi:hypothetical protein PGTUg99_050013 [Puccinia graminis f. sp. tritici]|uniref:Uncharacterized protein n=1 Tax=Puccinia graminis f. sp. tritici TaxID=56615 RepID=A0A5B0RDG4_PUCGR|nr:hypothetical protein PGTUg99_050013 [Puccinia graminis f. sp. tritici]